MLLILSNLDFVAYYTVINAQITPKKPLNLTSAFQLL